MADRYWVGGTGIWADTARWAATSGGAGGETVPTSADDVYFDSSSNATAYTFTVNSGSNCRNLSINAPASGKVTWGGGSALSIYGSLDLAGGTGGITRSYTGAITFRSTATGNTITMNGITLNGDVTFNGIGGGWQHLDAFDMGASPLLTVTNGAWDTNSQDIYCGIFLGSNSNVRSVIIGSSVISLNHSTVSSFSLSTTTNLTFSQSGSEIKFNGHGGNFRGGGLTFGTVTLNTSGNDFNVYNSFTCDTFKNTSTANHTVTITVGKTITVTNWEFNGYNSTNTCLLISSVGGSYWYLSKASGCVNATYLRLFDSAAGGGAIWNAFNTKGFSRNTGWNINPKPNISELI